jgi:peptidoglycan/xylan/chitin deacetylase (PgdA/CDA1 family)
MASTRRALRRTVKAAAAAVDGVWSPAPGAVVLLYHRVGGGTGLQMDMSLDLFEQQMAELAATRRVVPLNAALDWLDAGSSADVGAAPVVVTFDDGTSDFVDSALPVLVRYGLPVTVYVATWFIEEQERFAHGALPVSWTALADACDTGLVSVGSHTHRHRLLDRASRAEVVGELDRSIDLIGERLGRRPLDFAYPKALAARGQNASEVRNRFRSAAIAGTRANPVSNTDVYLLARSPIQSSDGMSWFRRKVAGGLGLEDSLRATANRVRYARART